MASVRRSASYCSQPLAELPRAMRRPESNPDLAMRSLPKLLVNVTVERSSGPVHVVMEPQRTVRELVKAAVDAYAKEGRRPLLPSRDPRGYELHYSQFSLECLSMEEKLMNLGSRNFFLCSRNSNQPTLDCRRDGESWPLPIRRFISSMSK